MRKVELSLQERRRGRKTPSLMGKSDANECNENSFSNCRVQLALSTKRDGVILEERYCNEEQNRLFGDLELAWGDSRMEDMLNDDSPYCDYSNMEDELYGYLERMIGQEVKTPPKIW